MMDITRIERFRFAQPAVPMVGARPITTRSQ